MATTALDRGDHHAAGQLASTLAALAAARLLAPDIDNPQLRRVLADR